PPTSPPAPYTTLFRSDHEDAVLLAGCTDLGVDINLRGSRPSLLVAIDRLPELRRLHLDDEEVRIGAALTLTEVERGLEGRIPLRSEEHTSELQSRENL